MKKLPPERRLKETEEVSEYAPLGTQPSRTILEGAATQKAAPRGSGLADFDRSYPEAGQGGRVDPSRLSALQSRQAGP